MKDEQRKKMGQADGFIAALDQRGGSTPKALGLYGVFEDRWSSDTEMFDLVHAMRARIMTSPSFTGERVLAAILFENTMKNEVLGMPTGEYLWNQKQIVPILKVDKGLADEVDGVQLMKPMDTLSETLASANAHGIFGTKMRSVIKKVTEEGILSVVKQQFDVGLQILEAGLVPIIEPEVDIHCPDKQRAEALLKAALLSHLDQLPQGVQVILKLTLPEQDNFYTECIEHPNTLRVVALSGGYSREESNQRLSKQASMIASFSRALSEGLHIDQTDADFNAMLDRSIESIVQASRT
jgi:fructose-bisphosphate aldolase, class I